MIDYHVLLAKYIRLVGEAEGVSFIDDKPDYMTDDEWTALIATASQPYTSGR